MKKFLILFLLSFVFLSKSLIAQSDFVKETVIFDIKGSDTLRIDKYYMPTDEVKPCLIFVFGGAFFTGWRDREYYTTYYEYFAKKGYVVAAIDYRLGLKRLKGKKGIPMMEMLDFLESSVYMAVEDVYSATNYILANANEWKVDPELIILSGSSAGGITVLQAEYERCNNTEIANILPSNFKYAGVISFAGAIFSKTGAPKWNSTPAPIQLFHGNSDTNVPFDKIKFGKLGLFGSEYIINQYAKMDLPYYFHFAEFDDHSIADTPMKNNLEEISIFIEKFVIEKQNINCNMKVSPIGKEKTKTKFKVKDYVYANFKYIL